MKNIKVLQVADLHVIGGLETMLMDFLAKPIPNFSFFIFSPHKILPFWSEELTKLNINHSWGTSKIAWEGELVQYALKNDIDLVHLHHSWRQAKILLKKAGIKVIEHDHGASWLRTPFQVFKDKRKIGLVDGVIAISNASYLMLTNRIGYPSNKITIIYNGVNFDRMKVTTPVPHPANKKIITTICRLTSVKGVISLIEAIPIVLSQRNDVEFWLIGDGPLRKELQDLATRLKINDYIKFWGQQLIIGNFLISSDLFVLPSIREPLGNVLIEASYFSKPTIASNVDGIPEVIIEGKTGILVEATLPVKKSKSGDKSDPLPYVVVDGKTKQLRKPLRVNPQDLAIQILKLLNDPKLAKQMGEAAHQRVVTKFNIERYQDDIKNYYYTLLREKGYKFDEN